MRVDYFTFARKIQIVQPRDPETQCRHAQRHGPGLGFFCRERARRMIRIQQGARMRGVQLAIRVHAPVVDRDGDVVQQLAGASEIEIDQAADMFVFHQHVVAEQVGVDDAARDSAKRMPRVEFDFAFQQCRVLQREKSLHFVRCFGTPCRAARIQHLFAETLSGAMHLPQHRTHRGAMGRIGLQHGLAAQSADDAGRFAVQLAQKTIVLVRHRAGAGNAVPRKVRHQVEKERQVVRGEFLKQRQHETSVAGRDEIIGVLDAGGNALQFEQCSQGIIGQPDCNVGFRNTCKYSHAEGLVRRKTCVAIRSPPRPLGEDCTRKG